MTTPWLTPELLEHARKSVFLPELEMREPELAAAGYGRRDFLRLLGAGAVVVGSGNAQAAMVFENAPKPEQSAPSPHGVTAPAKPLQLGEIPADFWARPRVLKLRRHRTSDYVEAMYWKDGAILPEGYWQACALLRDVRANRMTSMDPVLLDILRGIQGYYDAWRWPHPLTVTSGFRTEATNRALSKEGSAKNSMHLYGRAADCFMQGIDPVNIARLAQHLQTGGVGFYPSKNFVHVDTGRQRYWRG